MESELNGNNSVEHLFACSSHYTNLGSISLQSIDITDVFRDSSLKELLTSDLVNSVFQQKMKNFNSSHNDIADKICKANAVLLHAEYTANCTYQFHGCLYMSLNFYKKQSD